MTLLFQKNVSVGWRTGLRGPGEMWGDQLRDYYSSVSKDNGGLASGCDGGTERRGWHQGTYQR